MPQFAADSAGFNLRVAGVCLDDGRVLLHTEARFDYWVLPGGRPLFGETASDALRREMIEETGATVEVGRLLWVVENLFEHDGTPFHEIGFYFAMSPPSGLTVGDGRPTFIGYEGDIPLRFRWFPLAELASVRLLPAFLPSALRAIPDRPRHIVQHG
jgi:ADP-ribose pyrophosphatase YjhB (NUDIX family)